MSEARSALVVPYYGIKLIPPDAAVFLLTEPARMLQVIKAASVKKIPDEGQRCICLKKRLWCP